MKILKLYRNKIFIALAVIAILGFAIYKLALCEKKPYIKHTTGSGIDILFFEDQSLPYIHYRMVFVNSGSYFDKQDKKGTAALTASLLDQGAGGLNSEQLQEVLNYYGTSFSANVGRGTTTLSINGLSWHSQEIWDLFLKIITEARLSKQEFNLLKKQSIIQRQSSLDSVSGAAAYVWRNYFFDKEDPAYGAPTVDSLKRISYEDVTNFYKEHFKNKKPVVAVLGQIDEDLKKEIIKTVDEKFKLAKNSSQNIEVNIKDSNMFSLMTKKELVQSQVMLGFPTIPFPLEDPELLVTFKIARYILGGSAEARLMARLRGQLGLTYGVYNYLGFNKEYGVFQIVGATKTKTTVTFLNEILSLLKTFQEKGITEQELQAAKVIFKSRHLSNTETLEKKLPQILSYEYYYKVSSKKFIDDYLKHLDRVSLEDVNRVIKKYLIPENLNVLIYGHPSLEKQLSQIKGLAPLKTKTFKEQFKNEL